ncbi:GNAT family N-acetyltransferase [Youngiibacter multivorans]|uniref:GNAT superfamily N-acetyltransferase n=1 Tax=Youngiibacter multivorans TaxID=937251 RepID=A0ABS4FZQ5_9CLOT|nr:GNAT family N-acetyltransferase [Youngiibacter multivorans]MBP1917782.1 GNAT superfamily N-acetyltransferase [Youngiibacter multivorans]
MENNNRFRFASASDSDLILEFIKELAEYENLSSEVVATPEILKEWLFVKEKAEVIICEVDGSPAGFALFFHNFSTFLGRAGIYLEDLYIRPEYRGSGFGKAFMRKLAGIAVERGCGRFEWSCLDWNRRSIDFYMSLGARPLSDWTGYRLDGDSLAALVGMQSI